jgi:hypothetical protein
VGLWSPHQKTEAGLIASVLVPGVAGSIISWSTGIQDQFRSQLAATTGQIERYDLAQALEV